MSKVSATRVAAMIVVVIAVLLVPAEAFAFRTRPTNDVDVVEIDTNLSIENDPVVPAVQVAPRRYNQNCFFTPMNCKVAGHQRGFFPLGSGQKRLRRIVL
ncbi:hypothetical protein AAVH_08457 [Aphelenchoides avenae]|nr:hypothetical protein AAVH_08457 [Aphelenchus avenae]